MSLHIICPSGPPAPVRGGATETTNLRGTWAPRDRIRFQAISEARLLCRWDSETAARVGSALPATGREAGRAATSAGGARRGGHAPVSCSNRAPLRPALGRGVSGLEFRGWWEVRYGSLYGGLVRHCALKLSTGAENVTVSVETSGRLNAHPHSQGSVELIAWADGQFPARGYCSSCSTVRTAAGAGAGARSVGTWS